MDQQTPSHSSKLDDRILWFDGQESVDPSVIIDALVDRGSMPEFVTRLTAEIEQYNQLSPDRPLRVRTDGEGAPPSPVWMQEIEAIDVELEVAAHLAKLLDDTPQDWHLTYIERVRYELKVFERLGMAPILRACLYIVNRLERSGAVWGVGRGSAVASFLLYVIGIHDINSVKYDLQLSEFIGEQDAA